MKRLLLATLFAAIAVVFTGCQTTQQGPSGASRAAMLSEIANEKPGNYYIGRRYFKNDYRFWGYVRRPGQPWSTAQMVMLNENRRLAPDRAEGLLGTDNGHEYILHGQFSGDRVYEPASNAVYPEFVLTGYELRSRTPGPIFQNYAAALDPARRVIAMPF